MIIPTPEFDPLFAYDEVPFGEKMKQYIQREFDDVLGLYGKLLATHQGLETLRTMLRAEHAEPAEEVYKEARAAFHKNDRATGYAEYEELAKNYYASRR